MKCVFIAAVALLLSPIAFAKPVTFQMYTQPDAKVNPNCNTFTRLIIDDSRPGQVTFSLSDHVMGICQMFVEPNLRSYIVKAEDDGCGSKLYRSGTAYSSFRATDNRARQCQNVVPAMIVTEEVLANGTVLTLYSKDK